MRAQACESNSRAQKLGLQFLGPVTKQYTILWKLLIIKFIVRIYRDAKVVLEICVNQILKNFTKIQPIKNISVRCSWESWREGSKGAVDKVRFVSLSHVQVRYDTY